MAQALVENSERVSIRITTEDKSLLVRAASLENTNLTEFVLRNIVP
ncbi:type II toxin -antitoxin system TacA 1-like antitoxin, partial [Escherichia coli]